MNKLEQAARQALEALCVAVEPKRGRYYCMDEQPVDMVVKYTEAITALREALEHPEQEWPSGCEAKPAEQEPVAWALTSENGEVLDCISHTYKVTQPCTVDYGEPLYAAPVRTKDLTDDEIEWLVVDTLETWNSKDTMKDFARAVIAKYKEKNK